MPRDDFSIKSDRLFPGESHHIPDNAGDQDPGDKSAKRRSKRMTQFKSVFTRFLGYKITCYGTHGVF